MSEFLQDDAPLWSELVAIRLGEHLKVVVLEVTEHLNLALLDDAHINITARPKVVVDTCLNRGNNKLKSFILGQVLFVVVLQN